MRNVLFIPLLLTFLIISDSLEAQVTLGRKVFANGGTSVTLGGNNYNYTIGEAVIGTKIGAYPQLTMGFQQPIDNSLLPASYIDLEVYQKGNDGEITWTTVWEVNSKAFIIERSADQVHFQAIGKLDGAGESMEPIAYRWIDPGIVFLEQDIFYYRLRQLHLDGGYSFSEIKELRILKSDKEVICYPNPAQREITLQFSEKAEVISEVSFWNSLGQLIQKVSNPQLSTYKQLKIEVGNLPRGSYMLRVNEAGKLYVFRVLLI